MQYGLYSTVYMCSMDYTALCTCAVWIIRHCVHVQYGLYGTVYMCSMDYTALCTCAVSVRGIVLAASLQDTEAEVRHSAAVSLRPLPPCHVSHSLDCAICCSDYGICTAVHQGAWSVHLNSAAWYIGALC